MANDIKFYSELAFKILDNKTDYHKDKKIIKKLFKHNDEDYKETIRLRLTIIDSYYSTNMSRRYYGIEHITERIYNYYNGDQSLIDDLILFIMDPSCNVPLFDIFNQRYGISKKGEQKGKAISLISKYAYFLMDFQFPIYDSIVFETYPKIINRFPDLSVNKKLSKDISDFVLNMNQLNITSGINDFNKLDNLLWLIGKILRGNLSLILDKETYMHFVEPIEKDTNILSKDIDIGIRDYSFSNLDLLKNLVDDDLFNMISFASELKNCSP